MTTTQKNDTYSRRESDQGMRHLEEGATNVLDFLEVCLSGCCELGPLEIIQSSSMSFMREKATNKKKRINKKNTNKPQNENEMTSNMHNE